MVVGKGTISRKIAKARSDGRSRLSSCLSFSSFLCDFAGNSSFGQNMNRNSIHKPLNRRTLAAACSLLAGLDPVFRRVHETYGTPPLWDRPHGFATLLQIILEQQVSL